MCTTPSVGISLLHVSHTGFQGMVFLEMQQLALISCFMLRSLCLSVKAGCLRCSVFVYKGFQHMVSNVLLYAQVILPAGT